MKKIIFLALALATAGAGCMSSSVPTASTPSAAVSSTPEATDTMQTPPVASSTAPSLTDEQKILKELAVEWQKDGDLSGSGQHLRYMSDVMGSCTNLPAQPSSQTASLVPQTFVAFGSIAEHGCGAVLRVYLGCTEAIPENANAPDQWVEVDGKWYACGHWTEKLILEDAATNAAHAVADIGVERGGNSSALFVPIAFTKDDANIILDAWMGSPGAGGGQVDYGYDILSASTVGGTSADLRALAPRETIFFDSYGRLVTLANSAKLPAFSQPGPGSNAGVIMQTNLTTMKVDKLLEEPDTSYELQRVDPAGKTLTFMATHHVFTADCPRAEDALYCSTKTTKERTIALP